MSGETYPKRNGQHFAHKFCRLLTKVAAAQEIGPEACWLLTVIAHTEDAKHYSAAVTYSNEQLMPLCGFGGRSRLVRARNAAVEAGWLHYEPGGRTKQGRYWCLVPEPYEHEFSPKNAVPNRNGKQKSKPSRTASQNRTQTGTQTGTQSEPPSVPYPDPIPKPRTARGAFAKISREVLEDTDQLLAWHEAASNGKRPPVGSAEADRLKTVAAAERALEGDNPAGLFVWLLRGKHWDRITNAHEDRARERLNAQRRNGHKPNGAVLAAANGLAFDTEVPDDDE